MVFVKYIFPLFDVCSLHFLQLFSYLDVVL